MGIVSLDLIEPEMILAKEVRDSSGRVLLGQGAEVTEKHLSLFRRWGIIEVDIEGHGEEIEEIPLDPEVLNEAREKMKGIFKHNNMVHPFVEALHDIVSEREARKMMRNREVQT